MGWSYSAHEETGNAYIILVRKPRGKRPLGRLGTSGRIILKLI